MNLKSCDSSCRLGKGPLLLTRPGWNTSFEKKVCSVSTVRLMLPAGFSSLVLAVNLTKSMILLHAWLARLEVRTNQQSLVAVCNSHCLTAEQFPRPELETAIHEIVKDAPRLLQALVSRLSLSLRCCYTSHIWCPALPVLYQTPIVGPCRSTTACSAGGFSPYLDRWNCANASCSS